MGCPSNFYSLFFPKRVKGDGFPDFNRPVEFKEIDTKGGNSKEIEDEETFQRCSSSLWNRGSGEWGEGTSYSSKCSALRFITMVAKRIEEKTPKITLEVKVTELVSYNHPHFILKKN